MKHKKGLGSDDDEASSEDERIIDVNQLMENVDEEEQEEDDFFENSQELTQIVPRSRRSEEILPSPSPEKKKKDKTKKRSTPAPEDVRDYDRMNSKVKSGSRNGYRLREVDASEIPEHVLKSLTRLQPNQADCVDGLSVDDWEAASSTSKGGVWILQCPKDVNLSTLLTGKKLSLDGGTSVLGSENDDDDDNLNLTQFMPTDSLGSNVKNRQYEAVSVSSNGYKEGVVLMLPENIRYKLVAAPVQGHIIIRESVKELRVPKIEIPETKPRELPSGIKERHPVYGSDFTSILKTMEESPVKKKKKKKSKEIEREPDPPKFTNLSFSSNYKTDNEQEADTIDDFVPKKKKKKRKHEHDDDTTYEECSSFIEPVSFPAEEEEPSHKSKKSKKRKREEQDEFEDSKSDLLLLNGDGDTRPSKKSKKSKRHD